MRDMINFSTKICTNSGTVRMKNCPNFTKETSRIVCFYPWPSLHIKSHQVILIRS